MKEWKVTVAPSFREDIRNIHSYISNTLLEPETARNLSDRILKAVSGISELPCRYPVYEKEPWQSRGLRKMPIGNYLVFYLVNEQDKIVMVLRVFYAGRNIEKCLGDKMQVKQYHKIMVLKP